MPSSTSGRSRSTARRRAGERGGGGGGGGARGVWGVGGFLSGPPGPDRERLPGGQEPPRASDDERRERNEVRRRLRCRGDRDDPEDAPQEPEGGGLVLRVHEHAPALPADDAFHAVG